MGVSTATARVHADEEFCIGLCQRRRAKSQSEKDDTWDGFHSASPNENNLLVELSPFKMIKKTTLEMLIDGKDQVDSDIVEQPEFDIIEEPTPEQLTDESDQINIDPVGQYPFEMIKEMTPEVLIDESDEVNSDTAEQSPFDVIEETTLETPTGENDEEWLSVQDHRPEVPYLEETYRVGYESGFAASYAVNDSKACLLLLDTHTATSKLRRGIHSDPCKQWF
jgi:hypothetical protein